MSKNKLDSIKGLYRAQEQALGRELQRRVSEGEQQRQQELAEMEADKKRKKKEQAAKKAKEDEQLRVQ